MASLSTMKAQSECSRVVWVVKMELYGSTTAVEIWNEKKSHVTKFFSRYKNVCFTFEHAALVLTVFIVLTIISELKFIDAPTP